MNLKKRLTHIAHKLDQDVKSGKTTMLAKVVKDTQGILLTDSTEEASRLQRTHGITAKSIDINLDGFSGPFFLDSHAAYKLLTRAVSKIETLEKELEQYKMQQVMVISSKENGDENIF